jgi:hypothetical protein
VTDPRLHVLNEALDAAIECRVELHTLRNRGDLAVPEYLEGLRQVREVEDLLEPLRQKRGATQSRAFELCVDAGTAA